MIDDGEADWKVIAIDATDKWASSFKDIGDVEMHLPGTLSAIREWFRTYKIPDGKPPNVFGLNERFMNRAYALGVIKECNRAWKSLVTGEKERQISRESEEVKKLVRNLSKSGNLNDVTQYGGDDEGMESSPYSDGAIMF